MAGESAPAPGDPRRRLGARGEELARSRLEAAGYSILDRNVRTPAGEIDLVAEKDGTLVFVEVRTRGSRVFGSPEESLTPTKRRHMVGSAQEYLQAHGAVDREWRIDLVVVEVGRGGRLRRLDVIENAIES